MYIPKLPHLTKTVRCEGQSGEVETSTSYSFVTDLYDPAEASNLRMGWQLKLDVR